MVITNENENSLKSAKKKSTAILLCLIFFGSIGLHRFYVGKTKSGGLLLLMSFLSEKLKANFVGVFYANYRSRY